jgi:hypothetical protein
MPEVWRLVLPHENIMYATEYLKPPTIKLVENFIFAVDTDKGDIL